MSFLTSDIGVTGGVTRMSLVGLDRGDTHVTLTRYLNI
jgi:hypothetical protein